MQTPTRSQMQCPNPDCLCEDTPLGQRLCQRCKTPLTYRYLWAIGKGIEQIEPGTTVGDRYQVVTPQVWLDMRPVRPPESPENLPEALLPYLKLFDYRLHVPTIYSFTVWESTGVLLLENAPIDPAGKLLPPLATLLPTATPVRQVYWLWQLLDLWVPLKELGVATSLLIPDNLRVEGWRVRLRALYSDGEATQPPQLSDLARLWASWSTAYREPIQAPLQQILTQMEQSPAAHGPDDGVRAIALQLNRLLLEQAATLPLQLSVAAASASGPRRSLNEDFCFPLPHTQKVQDDAEPLAARLAIVCDGVGGHAGGEVASQMAVRSLQLQLQALLTEVAEQTEISPPDVVAQQIEALIRIANNLIATQNDAQEREARDRMGTTLVLALQLPQHPASGEGNGHELYLAHLGDSRAYWITPRYCHLLTVDDDIAGREVRNGRNLHREALRRVDGGILTQAMGTRVADYIYPTLQRFILDEDGVLLLCSDGLSDRDRVEQYWETISQPLFKEKATLEETAQRWVDLANEKSGHDNVSVVLMRCQVSPDQPKLFDPTAVKPEEPPTKLPETDLSESARALLYDTAESPRAAEVPVTAKPRRSKYWTQVLGLLVAMFLVGLGSTILWRWLSPESFNRFWQRYPAPESTEAEP